MPTRHLYTVYGITIASEFEVPELVTGSGVPDVLIRRGPVPVRLSGSTVTGGCFEANRDTFLFRVEGVARYSARAGREVVVSQEQGALGAQVRAYLLGHVLTAILHQRSVLVLHASGVVGAKGAVLFAGHSGAGKSTLLAALAGQGFQPIGDDVAVVTEESLTGRLLAHPGPPRVLLWADAVTRLGRSPDESCRTLPSVDKFSVRLPTPPKLGPEPLARLYVLSVCDGAEVRFEPIAGGECFNMVRTYTRNLSVLEGLRMQRPHFHLAAALASRVPIVRISRPSGRDSLEELVDHVKSAEVGAGDGAHGDTLCGPGHTGYI